MGRDVGTRSVREDVGRPFSEGRRGRVPSLVVLTPTTANQLRGNVWEGETKKEGEIKGGKSSNGWKEFPRRLRSQQRQVQGKFWGVCR